MLGAGGHPSNASVQTKAATNLLGHLVECRSSDNKVQEVKVGYNNFDWTNDPQPVAGTPEYDFLGLTIGTPYNYPQRPTRTTSNRATT